jgi:hypothetical protein
MTEEVNDNVYESILSQDGEAIEAYLKNIYRKSVPEPEAPTSDDLSFWKIAGLESSMFVLSAIGAAILSAIRTGGLFYILEIKLIEKFEIDPLFGNIFGVISMITALLAFEGFLLAFGLTRGKESGRLEVSRVGMVLSLITIVGAGVFSSFSIVSVTDGFQSFMNILLALITGSASAFIAFYAAENLGFILNHVTAKKNEILSDHQEAYMNWREDAVSAYLKSHYNIRHKKSANIYNNQGNSQSQQRTHQSQQNYNGINYNADWRTIVDRLSREQLVEISNLTAKDFTRLAKSTGNSYKKFEGWKHGAMQKLVEGLSLPEFIKQYGRFPSANELKAMGMQPNEVAIFIAENQQTLLDNGLLTESQIQSAIASLNE